MNNKAIRLIKIVAFRESQQQRTRCPCFLPWFLAMRGVESTMVAMHMGCFMSLRYCVLQVRVAAVFFTAFRTRVA